MPRIEDASDICLRGPRPIQGCRADDNDDDDDDIDIFINCSWVVTRRKYTFTHKQYIEQRK